MIVQSTILTLPGLGGSGPQHWQSYWERENHFTRIEQAEWETPVCSEWIENINHEVNKYLLGKVILVAHSLACIALVFWVKKFNVPVKGALLVAPADPEADSFPPVTSGFSPVPFIKLPFPSIVVCSNNDEYVTAARARLFADSWGSEFINIGDAGHINIDSGFGNWDEGLEFLKKLDQ